MSESVNTSSYRRGSVSFTTMPPGVLTESQNGSMEDIQISLAPYIQTYLSQTGRRHSCCSVMLPVAFERAAPKSWFDPRFDSPVLEGQYQASVFPQIRLRFRFALIFILISSLIWLLYFVTGGGPTVVQQQIIYLIISLTIVVILTVIGIWITHKDIYRAHMNLITISVAILICILSLLFLLLTGQALSPLGHFSICLIIILLIYTVIPLPLWLCFGIASIYSILFEILSYLLQNDYNYTSHNIYYENSTDIFYKILTIRILLQLSVHIVGVHILIMTVVRMRGTFMKVGQNLLVRRQLEMEKQLKEKMIHSMMPPKVADILMKESSAGGGGNHDRIYDQEFRGPRSSNPSDLKSLFRPFHMHRMENVSILFADIVGFTNMSSTKTAEQLVEILNDLFERFDDLCMINGCEKISTLGDCYYCVSGCPEPRPDHAICCVEMGLGMIQAMRVFDAQRHEGVKMRVGVHTGTVLCGIVGTKRVKFDVWSNDVTLANRMESSGRPEQVHVSEETCSFLGDAYILEEGEQVFGHRTYFVMGKKQDLINSLNDESHLMMPDPNIIISPPDDGFTNGVKLSRSATNLSGHHPSVPPASPVGPISTSLNPSPILSSRPRLSSLGKVTKFLISNGNSKDIRAGSKSDSKLQQPKILINTTSLPGGLDSDSEDPGCCNGLNTVTVTKPVIKDNVSYVKPGKYSSKFRNWRISRLLHRIEGSTNNNSSEPKDCDKKLEDMPCFVDHNGYQQLPIVIETPCPPTICNNNNTLDVPTQHRLIRSNSNTKSNYANGSVCNGAGVVGDNSSISQNSMFDDIIDIRSYISQSRSDISPFARTGSYRSQCGRTPQHDLSPIGRPRSSTITSNCLDVSTNSNQRCMNPWLGCPSNGNAGGCSDIASLCPSATSRKDSGIRSNSRRSSIQQQIYAINQTVISHHRVSGYFTSSQSSLSGIPAADITIALPLGKNIQKEPHPDPLAACLQQLRKQSDLQLIRCVRDNARSQRSYLVKPPLSPFTLFFKSRQMEHDFRKKAHCFGSENDLEGPPTLATPKYNTYIDILVSVLIHLAISSSLFLLSSTIFTGSYKIWVCIFVFFSTIQFFALFLCTKQVCRRKFKKPIYLTDNIFSHISNWYPWHISGALIMSLPVISILVNFSLMEVDKFKIFEFHYGFLLFVSIVHFCNFTQLNCWLRNTMATIAALSFVGIALGHMNKLNENNRNNIEILDSTNDTFEKDSATTKYLDDINWFQNYRIEIYLDLLLLLVLVWFLNREFEIGYRLSFYGSAVANQDKSRVQNMKNQADLLLHNIIPKHVAEHLKNTAKYSENHHNVGILFASIVNFNEMYDESYLGGKEYLRVLNELIGDFDELLVRSEFKCVEKIKTIGSTFMAASGLDPSHRTDDYEHLYSLLDFAVAMQAVVDCFNRDLLEFNLVLRVGYNFGDVTAGVIGTSKLYYDIWGDAVNVASRMDTTGVAGRIQVGKACATLLEKRFDFEPRGEVYVKGKDNMEVFLLIGRKPNIDDDPLELDDMLS